MTISQFIRHFALVFFAVWFFVDTFSHSFGWAGFDIGMTAGLWLTRK